jgi:hypothetical protein
MACHGQLGVAETTVAGLRADQVRPTCLRFECLLAVNVGNCRQVVGARLLFHVAVYSVREIKVITSLCEGIFTKCSGRTDRMM